MPEIIEIRKYADFIKSKLKNEKIINIKILNGRYKKHSPFEKYNIFKNNLPLKLIDVKTKGKLLYMIFEHDFYIFSTLGLSGGWCYLKNNTKNYSFSKSLNDYAEYINKDEINSYLKNVLNHLNVEFITEKGSLFYYDVLSFGTLKVIQNENDINKKLNSLGPDIMNETTTLELFTNQIRKKNNLHKKIGIVLMNQKIISGIGNYLRADVLYMSKINPFKKVIDLTDNDIKEIYNNSKLLTWSAYDIDKVKELKLIKKKIPSDYNRLFFVYNQETDINGYKVIKKELYEGSQKRFIYYVKEIQN